MTRARDSVLQGWYIFASYGLHEVDTFLARGIKVELSAHRTEAPAWTKRRIEAISLSQPDIVRSGRQRVLQSKREGAVTQWLPAPIRPDAQYARQVGSRMVV